MGQIATFKIDEDIFGVDLLLTKEISRVHEVTPVPEAPKQIYGLMNLRGQIVTVVKPAVIMEKAEKPLDKSSRLLILKTRSQAESLLKRHIITDKDVGEDPCALIVDSIRDVVDYEEDSLSPPPSHVNEMHRDLVKGVLQRDEDLIIVLNVSNFLEKLVATETE